MKTSTLSVSARVQGDGIDVVVPIGPTVNGAAPWLIQDVRIAGAGDVAVSIPQAPVGAVFKTLVVLGKQGSLVAKVLKGVGGDTGFTLSPDFPVAVLPLAATPANFVVTCSGGSYPEDLTLYYL